MDQALRGSSVIRGNDKVSTYRSKKEHFDDKNTINFIAGHSCRVWFNLRIYFCAKLISVAAMIICLTMKGKVDKAMLAMLFSRTMDLDWIFHSIFGTFNSIESEMIKVERVHKLEEIP